LSPKSFDGSHRRTCAAEGFEQEAKTLLHLLVRIENQFAHRVVNQPHRGPDHQFTPPGFIQDATS